MYSQVRYDNVSNNSDKLLKRLVSAHEELLKFNSEVTAFRNWLEKAYKVLEDKEKQLANLNKVIIKKIVVDIVFLHFPFDLCIDERLSRCLVVCFV